MRYAASRAEPMTLWALRLTAPRAGEDQAAFTTDIVKCIVLATYKVGGKGVVFFPLCGVDISNLAGVLKEIGLK